MNIGLVTQVLIFIFIFMSIVLHEISHGYAAYLLGDETAKRNGRLTLNPLHHVDIFGTIILPILLYTTTGMAFGYAKPVPINPYNFKNYKAGMGITGAAGPVANFVIAIFLGLVYVLVAHAGVLPTARIFQVLQITIQANIYLALFNLIPIPPLDGSRIVGAFLSDRAYIKYSVLERYGIYIVFGAIMLGNLLHISIIGLLINTPFRFVYGLLANMINALL